MAADESRKDLEKLDPLLLLGATRARDEGPELWAQMGVVAKHRLAKVVLGSIIPLNLSALPMGMHFLAAQISPFATDRLVSEDLVPVIVDARDSTDVERKIGEWDGASRSVTPSTIVARVPRSKLGDLARLPSVNYVEASTRLEPHCDLAHVSTGLVSAGTRTVKQVGRGVLVGVVDTGIDVTHPAFKDGSKSRIVNYLDQTTDTEYTHDEISSRPALMPLDEAGHGTHVAGIAAGNGRGTRPRRYPGVAPNADIAVVKTTFDSGDIALGVAHIFDVADERKQPCVVNLSLGGHVGGHDGTTVAERAIDQLARSGRLVVVSAGNEGDARLHAGTVLPRNGDSPARWVANFEMTPQFIGATQMGRLVVQVWHQHEDDIVIRLRSPNGELFQPPAVGKLEVDRGVFFVEVSQQQSVYSGDYATTFLVAAVPQAQWLSGWSVIAEERRSDGERGVTVGSVHAWILQRSMGAFTDGHTRSHLVGMPGTSFSAITVASYATRGRWESRDPATANVNLDAIQLEDISYFSSAGPTREGYNKPDVAAPGQWLISTLSRNASLEEVPNWFRVTRSQYTALQGTSMAAPYVTGALALLLEKDPTIDSAEAKRRLIKSAKQDSFSGPCWNPKWGYGKVDVEKLLSVEP